ncbi:MAG: transcriptional regulator [Methyloceanibacter sp.]
MDDSSAENEKWPPEYLKEFIALLDKLNEESHRGAVLVAVSYLDELLRRCLQNFLLDEGKSKALWEGFNAPLGTFSARALSAYSLGLVSRREYEECESLRKIRNDFAHNLHASFSDRRIIDLCTNLSMRVPDNPKWGENAIGAQAHFHTAAVALISALYNRPHYVKRKRIVFKDWPF